MGPRFQEYRPSSTPAVGVDCELQSLSEMPGQAGHDGEQKAEFRKPAPTGIPGPGRYVDPNPNYGALFEDRTLPTAQVLIVQGRYILTQSASGIMVVHIRRARERLFYDRFLKALTAEAHVTQTALFPVQVTVGVEGCLPPGRPRGTPSETGL